MSQFCQYEGHDKSPIIGTCFKIDCKYSRSYCYHCIIKHHISHTDDLKTFKSLNQWIKQQMKTYQDLKIFLIEIIQLSEGLSKFLVSINVNQQIDYSQASEEVENAEINKLIQIQMSKASLIPIISNLYDDLSNLKLEINRINQIVIKSNNNENFKNKNSIEQDNQEKAKINMMIQEKEQIKQYIDKVIQQQDQIQVQIEQIKQKNEQIKQLKLQQKYLNEQVEKQELENQKLRQQIEQYQSQESNQFQQFKQQGKQQCLKIGDQPTEFKENIDSQQQKVSFSFIKDQCIIVENGGKTARQNGGYTYSYVFCEPSIPLNQNVRLAFRISSYYDIELGIGSKDQSGYLNANKRYTINIYKNGYKGYPLKYGDTILLDIRMKEKKIIFKNLTSSYQQEMSIDTSEILYPCVHLLKGDSIEIVDDY